MTWTLPAADGTSAQVLSTNGSGTLSWATAGSSQWTTSGSDIYFNGNAALRSAVTTPSNGKIFEVGFAGQGISCTSGIDLNLSNNAYYNAAWKYGQNGSSAKINLSDDQIYFSSASSGTAGNSISYTQILAVQQGKSLALQGASLQTGTGITFPATQSASSDANTLDDYEEGTWTPTIAFGGASVGVTYNGSTGGRYVKIGKTVWVFGGLFLTSKGSSTGAPVTITGLPFAVSSSGETGDFTWAAGWIENITYSGTLALWGGSGGNPRFVSIASNSAPTQLSDTAFSNSSSIMLSFCYQTSN